MNLKINNFYFSINAIKIEDNEYNKSEDISVLKRELNKKVEINDLVKFNNKKYKPVTYLL